MKAGPHPGQTPHYFRAFTPLASSCPRCCLGSPSFIDPIGLKCSSRAAAEERNFCCVICVCARACAPFIRTINLQDPHDCADLLQEKRNFQKYARGAQIGTTKSSHFGFSTPPRNNLTLSATVNEMPRSSGDSLSSDGLLDPGLLHIYEYFSLSLSFVV